MGQATHSMVSHDATEVIGWTTKCISNFNSTAFDNSIDQFAAGHHESYTAMAIIAIAVGTIMLFFGYSLFYLTLALAGFLVGATASSMLSVIASSQRSHTNLV